MFQMDTKASKMVCYPLAVNVIALQQVDLSGILVSIENLAILMYDKF